MSTIHTENPSACGISPSKGEKFLVCIRGYGENSRRENNQESISVTEIFNRQRDTVKRKRLRQASPRAERILWKRLRRRQISGIKFRR